MASIMFVGLGVSACGSDSDSESSVATEFTEAGGRAGDEAPAATQSAEVTNPAQTPLTGQALATVAGVSVATSDVRRAVDDTLDAVARNNASVFTADVSIGDERADGSVDGSGYFVVKVAPDQLELLITDLGATVGTVSGRTQDTTDVTDQLVDLDIRIDVERDVIERFQALLTQASEFSEIVEIERVISERTISLEQLLASQRNLESRVELSTLTIDLQFVAPIPQDSGSSADSITDAWRAGWDVFVGIVFTIGLVLAVAFPFLASGALVVALVWLTSRRRTRRAHPTVAPPVPAPAFTEGDEEFAVTEGDEELAAPNRQP